MNYFTKRWRELIRAIALKFRIYDAAPTAAATYRAQQISAILRLTPFTMIANLLNAVVLLTTYWDTDQVNTLMGWTCGLLLMVIVGTRSWLIKRHKPPPAQASKRALKRATLHATALATIWGLLPILMFDTSGDANNTLILSTICTGMICAGGFVLATIPQAAISYVITLSAGFIIAIIKDDLSTHWDLAFLLFIYAIVICFAVFEMAKTYGARLMAEAAAEHQQQLVSLLLHDFESHASDWLWELDSSGCIHAPSKKLLMLLHKNSNDVAHTLFTDIFDSEFANATFTTNNPITQLQGHFKDRLAFHELVIPILIRGERHWWQLTAKPLINSHGDFTGWRGVGSDVTHKYKAELEMRRLANMDSLTNLANRHHFYQQLEVLKHQNKFSSFVLFFLDLDNFKNVNDSLGHGVGDLVLKEISQRLSHSVRSHDLLARLGGDEFAIISYGEDSAQQAQMLAVRLLSTFIKPCLINGNNLKISCSIGIAIAPEHGKDSETLLKNADMALYAAKSAGRNTFRFYEPGMEIIAQQKLHLLNDMRAALEEHASTNKLLNKAFSEDLVWPQTPILGQFEIHFQPQIKLASQEVIGFEALIRWRHPELGLISPAQFIPLAEESNLIIPIGTWVLVESCKYAAKWPQKWRVAVNLSAVQFQEGNVVDVVKWALHISRLEPERLELEITESLLIQDNASAQETLTALRSLGVRIALDDFGTGYSSLAYLRTFPLTSLKIDRSFVRSLSRDTSSLAIVNAIIQLADALMLETTAEGIETQLEAEILRNCGCSDAQGFYFGKPMPLQEALAHAQLVNQDTVF